jgi:hypothetical protein
MDSGVPNPPQWSSTIKTNFTQRFVCTTGINQLSITNIDLLDLKCVATAANAAYRLLSGLKVKKVSMWAANSAAVSSNTIALEWFTGNPAFGNDSKYIADTAVGTTNVAHIACKPPQGSFSASWLPNTATSYGVFNLTAPQGTVVDVEMTVSFSDDEAGVAVTGTVAAATVGYLYTRHLDSATNGTAITPIGVLYI